MSMKDSNNSNPLDIIMLGRSGSGKGTQAKLLVDRLGLEYIGTGDLLREFSHRENAAAGHLKQALTQGKLVPSWLAFFVWMEKLAYVQPQKGVLFDGSPRKLPEAQVLDEVLEWYKRFNVKVVLIDISREEARKRLLHRKVCSQCGKGAYIIDNSNKCKHCGGVLNIRMEDNPQAIETRLDWFDSEVLPVVEYYRVKGNLIMVNGERSTEEISQDLLNKLELV